MRVDAGDDEMGAMCTVSSCFSFFSVFAIEELKKKERENYAK